MLGAPVHVVLDGAGTFDQSSISSDGRTAVGRTDRQVQVWDLTTGTLTTTLGGHTKDINIANISADGRRAVSGGDDCAVMPGQGVGLGVQELPGHAGGPQCTCASSSSER